MRSPTGRAGRGLAAVVVATAALVSLSSAPANATGVGDTMIVQIDPVNVGLENALQAWGYGDGSGEGAAVVSSSNFQNTPSQRWKLTLRSFASDGSWNVTFESQYAYSGGKKCMTATQSGEVRLSTCANKATQIFRMIKKFDDPWGDGFTFYNAYFNGYAALFTLLYKPYPLMNSWPANDAHWFQVRALT